MVREYIYYLIVLLTFLFILFKNGNSLLKTIIILCFYAGLASFAKREVENLYKIILVVLAITLLLKNNGLSVLKRRERIFLSIFFIFSLSFLYSTIISGGYFNLIFSQYGKYVTPICLFLVLNHALLKSPVVVINLNELFISLLSIQILLSVSKLLLLGLQEMVVGSLAYDGGGPATMVPVLGFILVWLQKQGELSGKDWRYVVMLVFIAFASLKRAIWFVMPTFILLFMYYVPQKLKTRHLLYTLPLIPLIFYAGVRLNPTLNRDGKIGGSFDVKYVIEYTKSYNFGKSDETPGVQLGTGRGGATFLILSKLFNNQPLSFNDYFGYGLQEIYTMDYSEFDDKKYGVNSKGSVTGIFQTYIVSGYLGVILTILLIISVCNLVKETRIRNAIAILMFWDYFFYIGLILRIQALFVLLLFIIVYSNLQFEQKIFRKYLTLPMDDKNRYPQH